MEQQGVDGARIFVGVDWATEEHQVCVVNAAGEVLAERAVPHSGAGLAELSAWLLGLAKGNPSRVWVAIELPHGPVVETFLERGFIVHSINPKQMDRFRDRFSVAGAKDDRRDAHVLGDSLRTDTRCFRRLAVDEPLVIELREWSRLADDLQQERVRLGNRIREQLRRYYPQMLELNADVTANWFLELWELVSTPAHAKRARPGSIARVLKTHRIRKVDAASVLKTLRQQPLTVAPGTIEAATAHLQVLKRRVNLINDELRGCHRKLDDLCKQLAPRAEDVEGQKGEQRDVEILRSLPGVGRIVLATLLAEASQPLRSRDYHALRALSGVAPVTRNSGKRRGKRSIVLMRHACVARLRTALYHWARCATQRDELSRAKYRALRARGQTHGRALRGVADRLLGVACAMLRTGTPFDRCRRSINTDRLALSMAPEPAVAGRM